MKNWGMYKKLLYALIMIRGMKIKIRMCVKINSYLVQKYLIKLSNQMISTKKLLLTILSRNCFEKLSKNTKICWKLHRMESCKMRKEMRNKSFQIMMKKLIYHYKKKLMKKVICQVKTMIENRAKMSWMKKINWQIKIWR